VATVKTKKRAVGVGRLNSFRGEIVAARSGGKAGMVSLFSAMLRVLEKCPDDAPGVCGQAAFDFGEGPMDRGPVMTGAALELRNFFDAHLAIESGAVAFAPDLWAAYVSVAGKGGATSKANFFRALTSWVGVELARVGFGEHERTRFLDGMRGRETKQGERRRFFTGLRLK